MLRYSAGRQLDFADLTKAARAIPEDHVLLRLRALVPDTELDQTFAEAYDPANGRPSHPPALLFRMCLLEFLFDLSDRAVVEQVGWNLLYRRFVGLGWNDGVPDASTLSRFRQRVGLERLREVNDRFVEKARALGLLGDEVRVVDGTHVEAKVAKRSRRELCAAGRRTVLNALRVEDAGLAARLRGRFPPVRSQELDSPEARLEEERSRTRAFLSELEGRTLGDDVRRRAELLRRVALEGNPDGLVSFDDPDARFGHKTEDWTFIGYKVHQEVDAKSRIITAVDVLAGNEQEGANVGRLLDLEPGGLPKGAAVVGDGGYTNEPAHRAIRERGGRPVSPRMNLARQVDRFTYDAATDRLTCAAGKATIAKTRQGNGALYQFSMKDCANCPLGEGCMRPSELHGTAQKRARVWIGDALLPKLAGGQEGARFRKECYAERYKVEAVFSEQKGPRSRLGAARYFGMAKAHVQALFTAIATNALRLARWVARHAREGCAAVPAAA